MGRLFIIKEVSAPEDIRAELADPGRQWRAGYSAYELAYAWLADPNGLPSSVQSVLDRYPPLAGAKLIEAFFERKVELGTPGRPSQNDVLAYCKTPSTSFVVAVEGKVKEPFGPYVRDRAPDILRDARLLSLCEQLGLAPADAPPLRYQLLHRGVSALREARRYGARHAVLLVHSFDSANTSVGDYQRFAAALGLTVSEAIPGRVCGPIDMDGVLFHLAWVAENPRLSQRAPALGERDRDAAPLFERETNDTTMGRGGPTRFTTMEPLPARPSSDARDDDEGQSGSVTGFRPAIRELVREIRATPAPWGLKQTSTTSSNVSSAFNKQTGEDYKVYYDLDLRRAVAELGADAGVPVRLLAELVVALKDESDDEKWRVIGACRRDP